MSEDTTQEVVAEAPQGQAEPTEAQGVEDNVQAQTETGESQQSPEELEAEVSLFDALKKQKGWETTEDVAKAYKEAEAELTRRSQTLSKTQEEYSAMEAVLEGIINGEIGSDEVTDYQPPQDQNYQRLRKLEAKTDVRSVAERHKDFSDLQPMMSDILKQAPNVEVFSGEKGVELLYKMAKAEKMEQELSTAKKEGANELSLKEVEKVRATVADGTKAKSSSKSKIFTAADVANMDDATYMANRQEILKQQSEGLIN